MDCSVHRHNSFWMESADSEAHESLRGDLRSDVTVIGAGITGLTTAYLLACDGVRVVVVEADAVCSGASGFTTGKVTSQHSLIYASLIERHGLERAQVYAQAQQAAIDRIAVIAATDAIDCNIARAKAFVYTETAEREDDLADELAAAIACGLPADDAYGDIGLPWEVARAISFDDQLLFHPRRYCLGLVEQIVRRGGVVVERTRATGVDESDEGVAVTTEHGVIRSDAVVVATQTPFLERGGFFARTKPVRSYVLAARWQNPPDGMYISVDTPTRSIRPHTDADGSVLIVGGGGHPTGRDDNTETHYDELQRFATERFGMSVAEWQWSAQDFVPADGLPFIGPITVGSPRTFVATGYAKWGMTNGTVAAMVISDAILGRANPWADTFDSTRVDASRSIGTILSQGAHTIKSIIGDRIASLTAGDVGELGANEGAIVTVDGHRAAAFRHDDGTIAAVSATCTHLGCIVHFNNAERTWDCPCHGSRFALDGHVIDGPATQGLGTVHVAPQSSADPPRQV